MGAFDDQVESAIAVQAVAVPSARGDFALRSFAGDAGLVLGGALVANAFNYLYHFTLSRRLGPDGYGTLTTILAIGAIVGVVGSSVSVVAMQESARLWAQHLDARIVQFVRRGALSALALAAAVGLLILIVAVPLSGYVHIVAPALWVALALYIVSGVFGAAIRGAAQGAHRFALFSTSFAAESLVKLIVGVGLVAAGFAVLGAVSALVVGSVVGVIIVLAPMLAGRTTNGAHDRGHLELAGESAKVFAASIATTGLLFVDMIFAKHHLSGVAAGFYGAAGTIARTIPFGAGFVGTVFMPKAAAADHVNRQARKKILAAALGLVLCIVLAGAGLMTLFPRQILTLAFGALFVGAAPLLRLYAADGSLLAIAGFATAYLIATRDYAITTALVAAVLVESAVMAAFGNDGTRLLVTAISVNAALLPILGWFVARSLRR